MIKESDCRLIGRLFLSTAEVEKTALCNMLATGAKHRGRAGVARQYADRQPQQLADDRRRSRVLDSPIQTREMAARDMTNFMRYYSQNLIRILASAEQPGRDEKTLAARNEGV